MNQNMEDTRKWYAEHGMLDVFMKKYICSKCKYEDTCYGLMERLFKTDVETYVKGQVFEDDLMIWTYTHSYDKETHVHNFKGKGYNGKAKCTATFNSGDTIAVNGVKVPGYAGSDRIENAGSDIIINGRWCSFIYDLVIASFSSWDVFSIFPFTSSRTLVSLFSLVNACVTASSMTDSFCLSISDRIERRI